MKNRVISGCVTVTGPPFAIWRRKIGITEPDEPSTLPKRTATNRVETSPRCPHVSTIHSQSAFDWPMIVLGFAALSVETSTKRLAPNSTATSAIVRVPSVLLRTASIGFASIIATCLYAAAWKTTPGRYLAKTWRILTPSLTSATIGTPARKPRSRASSRSTSNSAGSEWSTSTSRAGPRRESWRQSSEPIEPPAPVTITTSAETYPAMLSRSTSTGSRPSTSSTCTGRSWVVSPESPLTSSVRPGRVLTGRPAACAAPTILPRTSPEADGIAISTSSGRRSRITCGRSAVVPTTRIPWRRRLRLRGSSSTIAIGV